MSEDRIAKLGAKIEDLEGIRVDQISIIKGLRKRIAELEKIIDLDTERFIELGGEIQELNKRIAELEDGLREIIDHAYENGSHARTMRKIAIGTLRGRRG